MSKRILLLLAVAGSTLFWSALIADISLRWVNDSFLVLFVLIALAVVSTSYLTYQITKRNQLTHQNTKGSSPRQQTQKQSRGNKTSNKAARERGVQGKTTRVPANKTSTTPGSGDKASSRAKTTSQSDTSQVSTTSGERIKGRIRVYYIRRSYGFVEDENKQTIFFHKSAIGSDIDQRNLTKKPAVSFVVSSSERGPVATDIQLEQ